MDPRPEGPMTSVPASGDDPILDPPAGETAALAPDAPVAPIPLARVEPVPTGSTVGGSRVRWLIGGGVALAAVAALALAAILVGARPLPEVFKYVPADSAIVAEVHPELPGDQRQRLGNFLAHFPGFADQSSLDQKIDEVLGRVVHDGSGGAVDYATQVKPLLAGPLAVSASPGGLSAAMSGGSPAGFLLVATTDAGITCDTVFGSSAPGPSHRDIEIRNVEHDLACAVHDRFLLLGDVAAVRAGLDARLDGRGLDGSSSYREARAKLEGDQLATVFASGPALEGLLRDASASMGQALPAMNLPAWMVVGLRVDDGSLSIVAHSGPVTEAAPPSGAPSPAPAAESRFAEHLPADTLGYLEVHGVGALVERSLATMRADPAQADTIAQLEQGLLALGGATNLTGWIEDLGIAVLPVGDSVGGAILIRGTDADAAAARLTQVRNLLALAATGTDVTVRDSEHAGVTITTVDLGDLGTLLSGMGVPADVGGLRLELAIAARDDLVVVGIGSGVVERVLDVQAAASLATSGSYGEAVGLAGSRNEVQAYVALDRLVGFVEGLAPADQRAAWDRDVKPYVDHLAALAWSSGGADQGSRASLVLTVK